MEKSALYRQGIWVIVALGVLTAVEYWASVSGVAGGMVVLGLIGLAKVALILYAFMHLGKIWQSKDGGHS
jgi:hypothetical protein